MAGVVQIRKKKSTGRDISLISSRDRGKRIATYRFVVSWNAQSRQASAMFVLSVITGGLQLVTFWISPDCRIIWSSIHQIRLNSGPMTTYRN